MNVACLGCFGVLAWRLWLLGQQLAEYGDVTRGPRIVNARTKAEMKKILKEIQSGKFTKEWVREYKGG